MDDLELENVLYEQIRPRPTDGPVALPYFFAGSGLSLRYLGLPTWDLLLERFATESNINYQELLSRVDGDRPAAAGEIAIAFHPVWFNDARYEEQRTTHPASSSHELPLKIASAAYLKENSQLAEGVPGVDDPLLADEVRIARKCVLDWVITTNYDPLMTTLYPEYPTFVGQDELILSDAQFVSEVYQIHGSVNDPTSLVLTSDDYARITKQSPYLVAKLLTIFVEHPIVFMGYSITDAYIQDILRRVAEAVTPGNLQKLADRLVFVEWQRDPTAPAMIVQREIALLDGGSLRTTQVLTHSFSPIFGALSRLERPFPRQLLRQLATQVYELFSDPNVTKTPVSMVPIDSPKAEGLSVVFGVGSQRDLQAFSPVGLRTVPREDLARDVIAVSGSQYADRDWLEWGLPAMRQQMSNAYLPVYKYLRGAGRITDGTVDFNDLEPEIEAMAMKVDAVQAKDNDRRRFERGGYATMSPVDIVERAEADYFKLECLIIVDVTVHGLESLRDALAYMLAQADQAGTHLHTSFWRALCRYDRDAFGPDAGALAAE